MTTFVLVPGMWIGAWGWREITTRLRAEGHDVYPLTLTGLAERTHLGTTETDLDTHVTDITATIETEELDNVVLVGHSYGGCPVTVAADRLPGRIARVVYVESGPWPDGLAHLDFYPPEQQDQMRHELVKGAQVPPRDYDTKGDPLLAGLSKEHLAELTRRSTPHPFRTLTQPVHLTGSPVPPRELIACTLAPEQVQAMIEAGNPFFAGLAGAPVRVLPTGHWPMFSEPDRLAALLSAARS
jgi:pimeloyl-ACP methyl ester carboxylesterase